MEKETPQLGNETTIEASRTQERSHTKSPLMVEDVQVTLDSDVGPLPASAFPHGLRLAMILVGLGLATFLAAIDMTIVSTAIPKLTDEFNSIDDIGWYGSSFFLTLACFQSTWGKVYRNFHLKWTYMAAVLIFEVGSLICAVCQNSTTFIVGRSFAGIGAGGILSGGFIILSVSVVPSKRPAYAGLLGAAYGIASVVGPLLGGAFTTHATWRWCFYINLPLGAVAVLILLFFFVVPPAARSTDLTLREKILQFDVLGLVLILAAVLCYLLTLQKAGVTYAWNSSMTIGLLVGFFVIFIIFCVSQWFLGERAMVVPRLLRDRHISTGMAFIFFLAGSSWILVYYVPIYFQVIDKVSAVESGIRTIPLILGLTVGTVLAGTTMNLVGYHVPALLLSGAMSVSGAALIYTWEMNTGSPAWIGYQALAGLGCGFGVQTPIMVIPALVKDKDVPAATAMTLFAQTLGGSLFISAAQSAFVNTLIKKVTLNVPSINPLVIVATGATEIWDVFPAAAIHGIQQAYMSALKVAFAISTAAGAMILLVALANPWPNIKKLNEAKLASGKAEEDKVVDDLSSAERQA